MLVANGVTALRKDQSKKPVQSSPKGRKVPVVELPSAQTL